MKTLTKEDLPLHEGKGYDLYRKIYKEQQEKVI